MNIVLLLLIVFLVFGGGGYYGGRAGYWDAGHGIYGGLGLILLVVVILALSGRL